MLAKRKYLILWMLFWLAVPQVGAQIQLQWLGPTQSQGATFAASQLRLDNQFPTAYEVQVVLLMEGAAESALRWTSQPLSLTQGEQQYALANLGLQQASDAVVPAGTYTLCLQVYRLEGTQLLAQSCFPYEVLEPNAPAASRSRLQVHGQLRLSAQYSTLSDTLQTPWPQQYVRLEASPQVELMGIPFQGQLFLTGSDRGWQTDYQMVGLQFDPRQFQQKLLQETQSRIQAAELARKKGMNYDQTLLQFVDSIKAGSKAAMQQRYGFSPDQLMNEWGGEALAAKEQLQRIEEVLAHNAFQDLAGESRKWTQQLNIPTDPDWRHLSDSLCQAQAEQCEAFQRWLSKREEYETLLARKAALEELVDRYEPYLKLAQEWQQTQSLEGMLSDPKILNALPGAGRVQQWMGAVKRLGLGTTMPNYDPTSLSGVSVNGIDMAGKLGPVYVQGTAGVLGRMNLSVQAWDSLRQQVRQRIPLLGLRGGLGQPEASFLHLQVVSAWQQQTDQTDLFGRFIPRNNQVYGLQGQGLFWENRLQIGGSWNRAQATVQSIESAQTTRLQDDALQGNVRLHLPGWQSRWEAKYLQVGPEYVAMGAPLLRSGLVRYGVEWEQGFGKTGLSTTAYWRRDDDPFQPYQFFRQSMETRGFRLQWKRPKWPSLSVDYAPYAYRPAPQNSSQIPNRQTVLSAQSQYALQLSRVGVTQFLQYARFSAEQEGQATPQQTHLFSLSQSLRLGKSFSLNALGTCLITPAEEEHPRQWYADVGAQGQWERWTLAGGWQYAQVLTPAMGGRNGGYLDLRFPLSKKLQGELRSEYHHYSSALFGPGWSEPTDWIPGFLFRTAIRYTW